LPVSVCAASRIHCGACGHDLLLAFCKTRYFCRAATRSAEWVEEQRGDLS